MMKSAPAASDIVMLPDFCFPDKHSPYCILLICLVFYATIKTISPTQRDLLWRKRGHTVENNGVTVLSAGIHEENESSKPQPEYTNAEIWCFSRLLPNFFLISSPNC